MKRKTDLQRRYFLKSSLYVAAILPFAGFITACTKKGADVPEGMKKLEETDPVATALGYVHDAGKVDTAKFPKFQAGQNCKTCAQYTEVNGGWGKCNIFPQGLVAADGWCNSFAPRVS